METKKWYQSRTIISGLLTLVLAAYMFARNFVPSLPEPPDGFVEMALGILASIGIFGRVTANTKIN